MGASQSSLLCGDNLLNKLYQQYGDNKILQFITIEKSKLIIYDKFLSLTRKFHQSFLQFQSTLTQSIQSQIQSLTLRFQKLKNKANSILPGGIAVLQRVKGKSINQFSGFNTLLTNIQSLKSQSINNLTLKNSQMITQIQQQKQSLLKNITKTQPSIPLYNQLPQPLKRTLFAQLEKRFSQRFTSRQNQLSQKIMGLFNASALYRMFQQMSPLNIIEQLIVNGFNQMERNLFTNIGGGIMGNTIGVVGNNVGVVGNTIGVVGNNIGVNSNNNNVNNYLNGLISGGNGMINNNGGMLNNVMGSILR